MAWTTIPNNPLWEYDNAPLDPGGAQSDLWSKQTNGIRTSTFDGTEIYTKCRMVGTSVDSAGELNKTYWDNQGDETPFIDGDSILFDGDEIVTLGGEEVIW